MNVIGYNYLINRMNIHLKDCLFAQHPLYKSTPGKSVRWKFHPFYAVISIKLHNFALVNISLAERSSLFHNIFLSTLPINQSKSSIENVSLLHFYRLQAVCDFLWRIPLADTSLFERNSEMISVYSQRPTHESLRISSTNSPDCLTFRIEMTGIILFFTEFCCRISYFS